MDIIKELFLNFADSIANDSTIFDVGKNDFYYYDDEDILEIIERKNLKIKYSNTTFDTNMVEQKKNELKRLLPSVASSNIDISNTSFFIEKDEFDHIVFFQNMNESGTFGISWIVQKKDQNFKNLVLYQNFYKKENIWLRYFHPYLKYICNEVFEKNISRECVERIIKFVPYEINLVHIAKFCDYDYLKNIPFIRGICLEIFKTEVELS
jgi:hypothetical protein